MYDQEIEVYFRTDAASVLVADPVKEVLLSRQFRMPTYLNGNESRYIVETCAGLVIAEKPLNTLPGAKWKKNQVIKYTVYIKMSRYTHPLAESRSCCTYLS